MTAMPDQNIDQIVSAGIRDQMDRQDISQRELAARIGWAQSQLSKRLTGRVPFRSSEIERIARALDTPLDQLMTPRALAG